MKTLFLFVYETKHLGHHFKSKMYKYSCSFVSEMTVLFPLVQKDQQITWLDLWRRRRVMPSVRRLCQHLLKCAFWGQERVHYHTWSVNLSDPAAGAWLSTSPGRANLSSLIILSLVSIAIKIIPIIRVIMSALTLTSVLLLARQSQLCTGADAANVRYK